MKFGVLIYDGVEPIDLATFGVLSMARRIRPEIEICIIAPPARDGIVRLANGLRVLADYDFGSAPPVDVLIVTGGPGWTAQVENAATLDFLRRREPETLICSVCTGAMIVAAGGLLDGKAATTKREVVPPEIAPVEIMRAAFPKIEVREASLVDTGRIITGGGVTLCIDTMLHLLQRLFGPDVAAETARIIEYRRAWAANEELFPSLLRQPTTDAAQE
jgi:transcriptional regulator GlxA family with amidase domain